MDALMSVEMRMVGGLAAVEEAHPNPFAAPWAMAEGIPLDADRYGLVVQ